jgi:hypothetical protein
MLSGNKSPISWTVQSKHTSKKTSCFGLMKKTAIIKKFDMLQIKNLYLLDEQEGYATLGHM